MGSEVKSLLTMDTWKIVDYTGTGEDSTLIVIYVDDVLILSRMEHNIKEVKDNLSENFDVRDMGVAKYCLELEFK